LATASGLLAQAPTQGEIDSLRSELERALNERQRLQPLYEEEVAAELRALAAANTISFDTVLTEPLLVVAASELAPVVAAALDRVLPYYAPMIPYLDRSRGPHAVVIGTAGVRDFQLPDHRTSLTVVPESASVADLVYNLRVSLGALVLRRLPKPLQEWSTLSLIDASSHPGFGPTDMYRLLASNPSAAVASCLAGVAADCWSTLGTGVPGPTRWVPAEEVRQRVLRLNHPRNRDRLSTEERADLDACVNRDIGACDRTAEKAFASRVPIVGLPRNALLNHALTLGGPGAYVRMAASQGTTVPEILSDAAGVSSEELVLDWVSEMTRARPDSHTDLPLSAGTALLWSLLISGAVVGAAAGRSV